MFVTNKPDFEGCNAFTISIGSEDSDKDGNDVDDRDSDPDIWKKYEDDEDYDNSIPYYPKFVGNPPSGKESRRNRRMLELRKRKGRL